MTADEIAIKADAIVDKETMRIDLTKQLNRSLALQAALGKEIWSDGPVRSQISRSQAGISTAKKRKSMSGSQRYNNQFRVKLWSGSKDNPARVYFSGPLNELFDDNPALYAWVIKHTTIAPFFQDELKPPYNRNSNYILR
jgi:effector-binding domain-containing protein